MPHATGSRRFPWSELPGEVRISIERLLGSKVIGATSQPGGFSEGVAARLRLAASADPLADRGDDAGPAPARRLARAGRRG